MAQTLYRSVYDGVIERVVNGEFAPGTMLPNEFELAEEFGVSQGTARKALGELEKKGVVKRRQGKGTFVTLRTPENSLFHFFRLRDQQGNQVTPSLGSEEAHRRKASRQERQLLFGEPEEVFEISRVRTFNNGPLSLEISVVPTGLFPGLLERQPLPNTLYVLFQQAFGCAIISAADQLAAGLADDRQASALGVPVGTPVLISKRQSHDLLERTVELRTSFFLTDSVHYSVELTGSVKFKD